MIATTSPSASAARPRLTPDSVDTAFASIAGIHTTLDGFNDIYVRKLGRADGLLDWSYAHTAEGDNDMAIADMVVDHRGDILVAGYLSSCDS